MQSIYRVKYVKADEIRVRGNIIADEKQATSQGPNTLSEEQMERLKKELQNQKTLLNYTCRMTHYTQKGVKYLLD